MELKPTDELLFFWVEEYKNLKNIGFNLSPEWGFTYYKESGKLIIKQRESLLDGFFGENIQNVTAIIGANGAGKTTFIEALLRYLEFYSSNVTPTFIAIWKRKYIYNNEIEYFVHKGEKLKIKIASQYNYFKTINFNSRKENIIINKTPIFYTNIFDVSDLSTNGINLSTRFLITQGERQKQQNSGGLELFNTNHPDIYLHNILEIKRQIEYCYKSSYIPFQKPKEIRIYHSMLRLELLINQIKEVIHSLHEKKDEDISGLELFINKFISNQTKNRSTVLSKLYAIVVCQIIKEELETSSINRNQLKENIQELFLNDRNGIETFLKSYQNKYDSLLIIRKLIELLKGFKSEGEYSLISGYWSVPIDNEKDIQKLNSLLNLTGKFPRMLDYISFSWDILSSGEMAFLKLFSRIYSEQKRINEAKDILLIIDEGELGFHPEWQKKYVDVLLKFVNDTSFFKDVHFQIIFTSHSPFVISDFPKYNVCFLKKDSLSNITTIENAEFQHNTFGANIHLILTDSFYLEGGYIGDFASSKIEQLIKDIESNPNLEKRKQILSIIDLIGEPLIQMKLKELYSSSIELSKEERINLLMAEIKKIEKEK